MVLMKVVPHRLGCDVREGVACQWPFAGTLVVPKSDLEFDLLSHIIVGDPVGAGVGADVGLEGGPIGVVPFPLVVQLVAGHAVPVADAGGEGGEAGGLRTFLTADDRIEKVAAFVAQHFQENVLPLGYKAFLVGVNREACAKYKHALDKLLPPEWSVPVYSKRILMMSSKGRSSLSFSFPGSRRRTSGLPSRRQTTSRRYS